MAWEDGAIGPKQETVLRELYDEDGLSPDLARQWLAAPVAFPSPADLTTSLPDISDRGDLVTQLLHVALADRKLDARECSLLAKLGPSFGISAEVLSELSLHFES